MTHLYDCIDWVDEARRIAAAFGVIGESEFVDKSGYEWPAMHLLQSGTQQPCKTDSRFELTVIYDRKVRKYYLCTLRATMFNVRHEWDERNEYVPVNYGTFELAWDGKIRASSFNRKFARPLARAFFLLGLVTPEIEDALDMTFTAHEKMEWSFEYDKRINL